MTNTNNIFAESYLDFPVFVLPDAPPVAAASATGGALIVAIAPQDLAAHTESFDKIIGALGYQREADIVMLLPTPTQLYHLVQVSATHRCEKIVIFGEVWAYMGLQLRPQWDKVYKIQQLQIVCSPSLAQLAQQPALKRPLWENLKQLLSMPTSL